MKHERPPSRDAAVAIDDKGFEVLGAMLGWLPHRDRIRKIILAQRCEGGVGGGRGAVLTSAMPATIDALQSNSEP